jgi:hypothetical protein
MSQSGSPRGTIHLYPARETNPGPSQEEIEEKQDLRGSINQELEKIQGKTANQNLHPYVDPTLKDDSKHIFAVYPYVTGNREIDGSYYLILDDLNVSKNPVFDFWGTSKDFVEKLIKEFPMIKLLAINVCGNKIPNNLIKIIDRELWKKNISFFTMTDIAKGASMKISNRVLSIAKRVAAEEGYHVIQTPVDEVEGPDTRWSVVPNKPSSADDKEAIKKFPTRDQAAKWVNEWEAEQELENTDSEEIDEESKNASDDAINANAMHDWMIPEDAMKTAWKMRESAKDRFQKELENDQ